MDQAQSWARFTCLIARPRQVLAPVFLSLFWVGCCHKATSVQDGSRVAFLLCLFSGVLASSVPLSKSFNGTMCLYSY